MGNLRILVLVLLFTGATQINGAQKKTGHKLVSQTFTADDNKNGKHAEKLPALPISSTKGRLLTPEEGCGFSQVATTKIVGGTTAKPGAWPWMALLAYWYNGYKPGSYRFACGGSLITSKHVLTAAHCINSKLVFVRLGEHDVRTKTDGPHLDVLIDRVDRHKNFSDMINDIAILTLEHNVDFTDRIRPICLPVEDEFRKKSFLDTTPFIAGWGSLEEEGEMSPVLQQIQLPVIDNKVCRSAFRREDKIFSKNQFFEGIICAGFLAGGTDNCQGDSGGPMMLPQHMNGIFPFYQIGVVSYGIGCGRERTPGIYTNVAHHVDWIKEKLSN